MTTNPWAPPEWAAAPGAPLAFEPSASGVDWRADARDFALVTAFVVVLVGPIMGLVWSQVGPQLPLVRALTGSASAYKNEVGADLHFLLLGLVAGAICAAAAIALRRDGPGALLGLVVGGLGAALVADRVGYVAHHDDTVEILRHLGVSLSVLAKYGIDPFFKVRALGVIVAWPAAALVLHTIAVAVRGRPR